MLQKKDAQKSRRRTTVYPKHDVRYKRWREEDAGRGWCPGTGLSFEGPHGMVTMVFFSGTQASFEGNPA